MIYLASPYSHPDPAIQAGRYENVLETIANMAKLGLHTFSPIVHWHEAALRYDLPKDAQYWLGYNQYMQSRCTRIGLLLLTGWQESKGLHEELRYADQIGQPIVEITYPHGLMKEVGTVKASSLLSAFTVRGNAAHGQNLQERDSGRDEAPDPLAR